MTYLSDRIQSWHECCWRRCWQLEALQAEGSICISQPANKGTSLRLPRLAQADKLHHHTRLECCSSEMLTGQIRGPCGLTGQR